MCVVDMVLVPMQIYARVVQDTMDSIVVTLTVVVFHTIVLLCVPTMDNVINQNPVLVALDILVHIAQLLASAMELTSTM